MTIDKPDRRAQVDDTIEELARRRFYERCVTTGLYRETAKMRDPRYSEEINRIIDEFYPDR